MSINSIEQSAKRVATNNTGVGFQDLSGTNPRPEYSSRSIVTDEVVAGGRRLDLSGSTLPDDTMIGNEGRYPHNHVFQTPAGHTIEYNDTPGSERIMIRHKDGTGVNMGPDGSVIVASKRRVDVIGEDHHLTVSGNGELTYNGNLTLNVKGDFNVNVTGDYNVSSKNMNTTVRALTNNRHHGNVNTTVTGNVNTMATGGGTYTFLETLNHIAKGAYQLATESTATIASKGKASVTSETGLTLTSDVLRAYGNSISIAGASGTIGGENVIGYVKNIYGTSGTFTAGVTAPTFHGDLDGTANKAVEAASSKSQSYPDGTGPGYSPSVGSNPGWSITNTTTDTTATAQPSTDVVSAIVASSASGRKVVTIDPGQVMKNSTDATERTGGVSSVPVTSTAHARSLLREQNNRNNAQLTTHMIANGTVSPNIAQTIPPTVVRVTNLNNLVVTNGTPIGNPDPQMLARRTVAVAGTPAGIAGAANTQASLASSSYTDTGTA